MKDGIYYVEKNYDNEEYEVKGKKIILYKNIISIKYSYLIDI